jgi:serine protease Do
MTLSRHVHRLVFLGAFLFLSITGRASAQQPFDEVCKTVNQRMVKLFGSGGFRGVASYGSGILVSPKGHILTAASQFLDTADLRVHLSDGRRLHARVLFVEPELDLALVEIKKGEKDTTELDLPYFDISAAAKAVKAQPGDWILAFHNAFQNASRDEPMTVQHGVITAYAKLYARRGITEAPFKEEVFFLDAIANNPGSAGGALTTRSGELIGIIGKEYRNVQSDTWTNYAIPLNTKVEVKDGDKTRVITLVDFVEKGIKGEWIVTKRDDRKDRGPGAYTGIVFVPNVVDQTPPYIESIDPSSPGAKAGLRPDDLVVYVDGEPVYSIRTFRDMIAKTQPGMTLKVEVRRGERLTAVDLHLTEFPKR